MCMVFAPIASLLQATVTSSVVYTVVCISVMFSCSMFAHFLYAQESKLYGAHFREIGVDSAKPTKVTFADSDDEQENRTLLGLLDYLCQH